MLKDLEFTYADIRATFVEDGLRAASRDVVSDATPQLSASLERRGLGRFLDVLFSLAKVRPALKIMGARLTLRAQAEQALLGTVFANTPPTARRDIYGAILPPSLGMFFTTGQQLNTLIKKHIQALIPIAFSTFTELQERGGEFEDWIRSKAGRKDNELGELLHAFRGSCLTSLPEFISETKVAASRTAYCVRPILTEPVVQNWGNKSHTPTEGVPTGVNPTTGNVSRYHG